METPDPRSSSAQADQPALRGFWCLIITQFQGAFSDNVLKNLVIFMMLDGSLSRSEEHRMGELITALFSLPFILFSMAGGFLADRFSKRTVMLGVKIFEILVMLFALAGFVLRQTPMLVAGIFLMGTHSAFFGPSKYGSLPELLPERRLSWGNGILELGTFVAIILGTVAASVLAEGFGRNQVASGWILLGLAAVGLVACLGITRVPAADPAPKVWREFHCRRDRALAPDARGPAVGAGDDRQSFLQFPWLAADSEPVFLWGCRAARLQTANRLSERCAGPGHRLRERRRGLSFGWQNRVRVGAAGGAWNVCRVRVARGTRFVTGRGAGSAGLAGVRRRLFHSTGERLAATPPRQGEKGRSACRR